MHTLQCFESDHIWTTVDRNTVISLFHHFVIWGGGGGRYIHLCCQRRIVDHCGACALGQEYTGCCCISNPAFWLCRAENSCKA